MADLILHHYDEAPFAEKVRLVFGIKNLSWRSVIQPAAMPKPDLMPLTGGCRRTPVLQIGADIYCALCGARACGGGGPGGSASATHRHCRDHHPGRLRQGPSYGRGGGNDPAVDLDTSP
jgi:glutathione S-transferase-like protein